MRLASRFQICQESDSIVYLPRCSLSSTVSTTRFRNRQASWQSLVAGPSSTTVDSELVIAAPSRVFNIADVAPHRGVPNVEVLATIACDGQARELGHHSQGEGLFKRDPDAAAPPKGATATALRCGRRTHR